MRPGPTRGDAPGPIRALRLLVQPGHGERLARVLRSQGRWRNCGRCRGGFGRGPHRDTVTYAFAPATPVGRARARRVGVCTGSSLAFLPPLDPLGRHEQAAPAGRRAPASYVIVSTETGTWRREPPEDSQKPRPTAEVGLPARSPSMDRWSGFRAALEECADAVGRCRRHGSRNDARRSGRVAHGREEHHQENKGLPRHVAAVHLCPQQHRWIEEQGPVRFESQPAR